MGPGKGWWAAVVGKYGLLVLEVHCLEPRVSAEHLHMSASLYFDTCQAMSRQWLMEPHVWLTFFQSLAVSSPQVWVIHSPPVWHTMACKIKVMAFLNS